VSALTLATTGPSTLTGLGPVHVKAAAQIIAARFGITQVYGWRATDAFPDHPAGLAVDFPCSTATGDALAAYCQANSDALGVKYVCWRQRIWYPGGDWQAMADRGSASANHENHVHVSFTATGAAAGALDKLGAAARTAVGAVTGAVTGAAAKVNPFANWDRDAAAIGLKLAIVAAGLTLVTLGAWRLVLPAVTGSTS
jgi:hypothetical protein